MLITLEDLGEKAVKIDLVGRMDVDGSEQMDTQLADLTGTTKQSIVVDLSQVTFLASIGIRSLLMNAKALQRRGGTMVLLKPQPMVAKVLTTTGVDALIPMFDDLAAARAAVSDAAPVPSEQQAT
jgi:anti-anti-sigma factor